MLRSLLVSFVSLLPPSHPLLHRLFALLCTPLSAAALLLQTRWLLDDHWPQATSLAVFMGASTLLAYQVFTRQPYWRLWSVVGGGCAGVAFFTLTAEQQGATVVAALLWLLYYGSPLLDRGGLREHPWWKPLLVAATWAWVTVALPTTPQAWPGLWPVFLERGAFVFALALAYDLHDAEADARFGLRTLARQLELAPAFRLIYGSLVVAGAAVCWSVFQGRYTLVAGLALAGSLLVTTFALRAFFRVNAHTAQRKTAIDALMLFQFACVAGANVLQIWWAETLARG